MEGKMKASELRIGNWITADGKESQAFSLYEYDESGINGIGNHFEAGQYTYPVCEPIQLTDEWLVRFGLVSENLYTKGPISIDVKTGEVLIGNGCYECAGYWTEVKYVHQLQNLYFALTGEDLVLK